MVHTMLKAPIRMLSLGEKKEHSEEKSEGDEEGGRDNILSGKI